MTEPRRDEIQEIESEILQLMIQLIEQDPDAPLRIKILASKALAS